MFGENTGKIQVFVILPSFCDFVHVQSVKDLFAKQLNNALKPALNHQNTGKITKIQALTGDVPQMPIYTGAPAFIRANWAHWSAKDTGWYNSSFAFFCPKWRKKVDLEQKRYPVPQTVLPGDPVRHHIVTEDVFPNC